jgi:HEAT repeat protein
MLDARLIVTDIASGDKKRREEATRVISELDQDTSVDESVFVEALSATDDDVVFWSVIALEHLGERGSAAIPSLIDLLKREQLFLRQSALKALAKVGPNDAGAKAGIFRSFEDASPFVRRDALQACIDLYHLSADELAAIAAMATDSDETVSRWSEITLRNIRVRARKTG